MEMPPTATSCLSKNPQGLASQAWSSSDRLTAANARSSWRHSIGLEHTRTEVRASHKDKNGEKKGKTRKRYLQPRVYFYIFERLVLLSIPHSTFKLLRYRRFVINTMRASSLGISDVICWTLTSTPNGKDFACPWGGKQNIHKSPKIRQSICYTDTHRKCWE